MRSRSGTSRWWLPSVLRFDAALNFAGVVVLAVLGGTIAGVLGLDRPWPLYVVAALLAVNGLEVAMAAARPTARARLIGSQGTLSRRRASNRRIRRRGSDVMRLIAGVLFAVLLAGCADGAQVPSGDDVPASPEPAGDAVSMGGAASCVEEYGPETLAGRDFAFDGTVEAVGEADASDAEGDSDGSVPVTFTVAEWFAGGDGDRVTVDMPAPGMVSSDGGIAYEVGSRLLVSGEPRFGGEPLDGAVAWGCGFTRAYDEATAAEWRATFPGQG